MAASQNGVVLTIFSFVRKTFILVIKVNKKHYIWIVFFLSYSSYKTRSLYISWGMQPPFCDAPLQNPVLYSSTSLSSVHICDKLDIIGRRFICNRDLRHQGRTKLGENAEMGHYRQLYIIHYTTMPLPSLDARKKTIEICEYLWLFP